MTNTKWLRRALLGGVALSVMASGAQADELSNLKSQLASLQSRVNSLETAPVAAAPAGANYLTVSRGQGSLANFGEGAKREGATPADRGFTIAVTPTADLPAPVAEVTVYGYVKGDVIYDFDGDKGTEFHGASGFALNKNAKKNGTFTKNGTEYKTGKKIHKDHIQLHARQTRFGIKSKVDTAIGQIRAHIEGDFFGNGSTYRMRHAYGEWDMTPNWTLLVGQTWYTAALLPIGITTVDFSGPAGPSYSRRAQVRLTYHDGPMSWGASIEDPSFKSTTNLPDFNAFVQWDAPGGHQFILTGNIADYSNGTSSAYNGSVASKSDVGWAIQAGANINLADMAYLTGGVGYGKGQVQKLFNVGGGNMDAIGTDGKAVEALSAMIGFSYNINEATTFNVAYGRIQNLDKGRSGALDSKWTQTVHANVLWQPVKQMRMGWEVMWGQEKLVNGVKDDAIRAQFGTWFFF